MGLHMMKIWTFLEKEYQIEDKNPPRKKGEKVDNMELPRKGGVMMRLTLMMDDSDDDGITFICGRQYPLLRMAGITLCS